MFQSLSSFLEQAQEPAVSEPLSSEAELSEPTVPEDSVQEVDPADVLEETLKNYFGDADAVDDSVVEDDAVSLDHNADEIEEETDFEAAAEEEPEEELESQLDDVFSADSSETAEDTDLDGLWDELLDDLVNAGQPKHETGTNKSPSDELAQIKQTLESLVSWQTAVQQYLQTSVEAENIRQVAQQLAGLGVILPDEQIQEIARLSQQLNIPPSVLLKAKAYDYTMQKIQQDDRAPYPFMNPSRPPAPNILPNARPFQEPAENAQKRTGFTGFREFLKQMGISEE